MCKFVGGKKRGGGPKGILQLGKADGKRTTPEDSLGGAVTRSNPGRGRVEVGVEGEKTKHTNKRGAAHK